MPKTKGGQTEQAPKEETVETDAPVDADALAGILRQQMEEPEEVPNSDKPPEDPPASAEQDEGSSEDVLSNSEDAEAEPAAKESEVEADSGELPRGVQKRIDKLTAQKRAIAEEKDAEIADLKQQLESKTGEPGGGTNPANGPCQSLSAPSKVR